MEVVMMEFKDWCGLPNVHGVEDNTHISMSKPNIPSVEDYSYYKTRGYSIVTFEKLWMLGGGLLMSMLVYLEVLMIL